MIGSWPSTSGQHEYALVFDKGREHRLLVLAPLFDEANKTRHLLVETMRRLDAAGIDVFLPDLPGCNESLAPLEQQSLESWRDAAAKAAAHFGANRLLSVRTSAVIAPNNLPGWRYAAKSGASSLKSLLRARTISAREAGIEESGAALIETGRQSGLDLAGYRIGPEMIRELEVSRLADSGVLSNIDQKTIGGVAPWLRAEPDFDPAQADSLAAIIAVGIAQ